MAESEEELKSLLMKVKEESEKVVLSLTFRKLRSWHLVPLPHGKYIGRQWKQCQTLIFCAPKSLQMDCSHEIKRRLLLGRKVMTNLDSRDFTLPTKVHLVKAMVFPVVMYGCELDCEESWVPKNRCFWTMVLEKTLESPLDCKEIQPVHPEDQSWVFIGRTDTEAETLILWPPHAKSWLIGKDPDAGMDWGQEKRTTEDELVGWQHWLDGHEFE